jgi:hypothetical protein
MTSNFIINNNLMLCEGILQNVKVNNSNKICKHGYGIRIIFQALEYMQPVLLSMTIGIVRNLLKKILLYLKYDELLKKSLFSIKSLYKKLRRFYQISLLLKKNNLQTTYLKNNLRNNIRIHDAKLYDVNLAVTIYETITEINLNNNFYDKYMLKKIQNILHILKMYNFS